MSSYYDLVLGLIPMALVGVSAALHVGGFSLTTAVPVGAVVSVGLIGHAMFVRAPVDDIETSSSRDDSTRTLEPAD